MAALSPLPDFDSVLDTTAARAAADFEGGEPS
jgi:hypothetical protein